MVPARGVPVITATSLFVSVEITAPAEGDWTAWLEALPEALGALDLSRVQRVDPDEE